MFHILLLCTIVLYSDAIPIPSLEVSSEVKATFPADAEQTRMQKADINLDGALSATELEHEWIIQNGRTDDEKAKYYGNVFQEFDEDFDLSLTPEEAANMMRTRYLVAVRDDFPFDFLMFDEDRSMGLELFEYIKFESKFPFTKTDPLTIEELEELAKAEDSTKGDDMENLLEESHEGESDRIVNNIEKMFIVEDITKDKIQNQEPVTVGPKFEFPLKKTEKMPLMKPAAHQVPSAIDPSAEDIANIMGNIDEWHSAEQSTPPVKPVVPGFPRSMISLN